MVTELLKNYTTFIRILFEVILNDKELFNTTFTYFQFKDNFIHLGNIVNNWYNPSKLLNAFKGFMNDNKNDEQQRKMFPKFFSAYGKIMKKYVKEKEMLQIVASILQKVIKYTIDDFNDLNISEGCYKLINFTFFNSYNNNRFDDDETSIYHLSKFLFETSKKPNDLLTYDSCIQKNNYFFKNMNKTNSKISHKNVFVMAFLDKNNENTILPNSKMEKLYYMSSFCLPQGEISKTNEVKEGIYYYCNDSDYSELFRFFNNLFFNIFSFLTNL